MSLELKIIINSLIFMALLNISLGFIIDASLIDNYDQQQVINDLTGELGTVAGFITSTLLDVGQFLFSLFGVDFIASISILPVWVITLLVLYNVIVAIMVVFYIIDRVWVG